MAVSCVGMVLSPHFGAEKLAFSFSTFFIVNVSQLDAIIMNDGAKASLDHVGNVGVSLGRSPCREKANAKNLKSRQVRF